MIRALARGDPIANDPVACSFLHVSSCLIWGGGGASVSHYPGCYRPHVYNAYLDPPVVPDASL